MKFFTTLDAPLTKAKLIFIFQSIIIFAPILMLVVIGN